MSLEKNFPTFTNSLDKSKKEKRDGVAKSLGRKALPYIAAFISFLATPKFSNGQETKKDEGNIKLKNTEEVRTKLQNNGDHGNLEVVFTNKKATAQEKNDSIEQNVFNSFDDIMNLIKDGKDGKDGHYYTPSAEGEKSPYWHKKIGDIEINSIDDYKNHVEKKLRSQGFKGDSVADIKYFGFKLEKDEFITTIKQDVVVNAKVIGGSGYVLLKAGTGVIFKLVKDKQGRNCNKLLYILSCMNPIDGDNPYTNTDGSGGYRV